MSNQDNTKMTVTTGYVCHECQRLSDTPPQRLDWGHECWGKTKKGQQVAACESRIEEAPIADLFEEIT